MRVSVVWCTNEVKERGFTSESPTTFSYNVKLKYVQIKHFFNYDAEARAYRWGLVFKTSVHETTSPMLLLASNLNHGTYSW